MDMNNGDNGGAEVKVDRDDDSGNALGLKALSGDNDTGQSEPDGGDAVDDQGKASDGVAEYELPEQYLDADGTPNMENITKSLVDMRAKIGEMGNVPETYEANIPDLDEGLSFELDAEQFDGLAKVAKENGLSQKAVDDLLGLHVALTMQSDAELAKVATQEMVGSLGSDWQEKVQGSLQKFEAANGIKSDSPFLDDYNDVISTPAGARFIHALAEQNIKTDPVPSGNGVKAETPQYTAEQLRVMLRDEKYGKDVAFTKNVDDSYRKLHGG